MRDSWGAAEWLNEAFYALDASMLRFCLEMVELCLAIDRGSL